MKKETGKIFTINGKKFWIRGWAIAEVARGVQIGPNEVGIEEDFRGWAINDGLRPEWCDAATTSNGWLSENFKGPDAPLE